jgi:hypothetical protein
VRSGIGDKGGRDHGQERDASAATPDRFPGMTLRRMVVSGR